MKPFLLLCFVWCGLLVPIGARAQTVDFELGAGAGSGLEIGSESGGGVVLRRSPVFVAMDVGLLLDNDRRFELGAAMLLEVDGRVGVAVEPLLRINTTGKKLHGYVALGIPIFFAPYTLYGVSIGPGISYRPGGAFNLFAEIAVRAYPFGNDLPDDSALFHLDGIVGVRHTF
jgi:hypothetical protein